MLKQTRFTLGLNLIVQAVSCFFLAICYLFGDKKRTALPFTVLGVISAAVGGFLMAEKIKEHFENADILDRMEDIRARRRLHPETDIPVDDTADETEFN